MNSKSLSAVVDQMQLKRQLVVSFDKWKRITNIVSDDPTKYRPNKPLPVNLRVPSSGTHFYKLGFSNFRNGCSDRHWIFHPFLVFLVPFVNILRFAYSILTPDLPPRLYLYLGDFGYFMDMRVHLNLTAMLVFCMGVASQLIHLYNYVQKKEPTYMKVFNMIAGRVPPCAVQMTDELSVRKLVKLAKLMLHCNELMLRSMVYMASLMCFSSLVFKNSVMDIVLIGVPHSVLFGLAVRYVMNSLCTQIFYFYILSYYLKLKQRDVDDYLRYAIDNKKDMKIMNSKRVTNPLNWTYLEIIEYDSNFWSKFIGVVWSASNTVIALVIFMFAFSQNMHFFTRLVLFYAIFFYSLILFSVVYPSASVNLEVEVAYKLLASYKLVTMQTKQSQIAMARHGIKVKMSLIFLNFTLSFISDTESIRTDRSEREKLNRFLLFWSLYNQFLQRL